MGGGETRALYLQCFELSQPHFLKRQVSAKRILILWIFPYQRIWFAPMKVLNHARTILSTAKELRVNSARNLTLKIRNLRDSSSFSALWNDRTHGLFSNLLVLRSGKLLDFPFRNMRLHLKLLGKKSLLFRLEIGANANSTPKSARTQLPARPQKNSFNAS